MIDRVCPYPGLHNNHTYCRHNLNKLPMDALQDESASKSCAEPERVAAADIGGDVIDFEARRLDGMVGRFQQLCFENDLHAIPGAIVGQKSAKAGVVSGRGIERSGAKLTVVASHQPRRVGLGAHWLPDQLLGQC